MTREQGLWTRASGGQDCTDLERGQQAWQSDWELKALRKRSKQDVPEKLDRGEQDRWCLSRE